MQKNDSPHPRSAPVACPNCSANVELSYCPSCGQRRIPPDDLSLKHAIHALIHEITHLDGRLWKTLFLLLRRPGQLTVDYVEGRRNRHIHPFRLFLLFSALYYFIGSHSSFGLKTVVDFSPKTARNFTDLAKKQNLSLTDYVNRLEASFLSRQKGFQIASVVLTGLMLWVLFRRRNRQLVFHQMMAIHLKIFSFIVSLLLFPLWSIKWLFVPLTVAEFSTTSVYYAFAFRRVYRSGWASTLGKLSVLIVVDTILNLAFWFTLIG